MQYSNEIPVIYIYIYIDTWKPPYVPVVSSLRGAILESRAYKPRVGIGWDTCWAKYVDTNRGYVAMIRYARFHVSYASLGDLFVRNLLLKRVCVCICICNVLGEKN